MSDLRCPGCNQPSPTHRMGCKEVIPAVAILTSLIAELRDHYENCTDCGFMEVAADEAEARLLDTGD